MRPRLLIISLSFFGYEQAIAEEFERLGYAVSLIDDRLSNKPVEIALLRVRRSLMDERVRRHFEREIERVGRGFTLVLVIKGEVVPPEVLARLRAENPDARFVFYAFDSIARYPRTAALFPYMDVRLSFDRHDVAERSGLAYLPLFHTREFHPPTGGGPRAHELTFVGTVHSDRYPAVRRLLSAFERVSLFLYVQARWYFWAQKLTDRRLRGLRYRDVSFDKLSRAEVAERFRSADAVLDLQRTGQAGLTMRTFEALACGAILVTTNPNIGEEPFYDPARIIVLPDDLSTWDADAIAEQVRSRAGLPTPEPDWMAPYSLESWVQHVLNAVGA